MTKSARTYELEEIITIATARPNRIGCPEVWLDDYGIVDFVSMDIDGPKTVRCFELKISKSDFLSDAKKTFIGDYNYYVLPTELWGSVRNLIEPGIGVWLVDKRGHTEVKKKAKRMQCQMPRARIMGKILRALNREEVKHSIDAWKRRQLSKPVRGVNGESINIEDIVEYRGEQYKVLSIIYVQEQLSLKPELLIEPVLPTISNNHEHRVLATLVKKVGLSDVKIVDQKN